MNFDYSYRAFLITSLLFGILFLGMYSIKLSRYTEVAEKEFDVEYAVEEILPDEEQEKELASAAERIKIETNRAYNEAEKFISELEDSREEPTESTEAKLQAMNDAITNASGVDDAAAREKAKKKLAETKATLSKNKKNTLTTTASSRQTTISYSLVNRKALELPNPVYTCEGFGKVVISIEVNQLGKVVKTAYNKSASTTTNECLIDSAIEYAREARFTTDGARLSQLGTISYHFPGQQ